MSQDSLEQIYSNKESLIYWAGISRINDKVYFAIGKEIFTYDGNEFVLKLSTDNNKFYSKVFGRHEKDILWVMSNGFEHYNGNNQEYLYTLPSRDMDFYGEPLIIGDHIYCCMWYPGFEEMILHGYLEE